MKRNPTEKQIVQSANLLDPESLPDLGADTQTLKALARGVKAQGLRCVLAVWTNGEDFLLGLCAFAGPASKPSKTQLVRLFRNLQQGPQVAAYVPEVSHEHVH